MLHSIGPKDLHVPFQAATEFLAGVEDPVAGLHLLVASYGVVMPTHAHLLEAARLARRPGRRPNWGDIHIAAHALLESTYVITANPKDFRALDCMVWDYRNEPAPPQTR